MRLRTSSVFVQLTSAMVRQNRLISILFQSPCHRYGIVAILRWVFHGKNIKLLNTNLMRYDIVLRPFNWVVNCLQNKKLSEEENRKLFKGWIFSSHYGLFSQCHPIETNCTFRNTMATQQNFEKHIFVAQPKMSIFRDTVGPLRDFHLQLQV